MNVPQEKAQDILEIASIFSCLRFDPGEGGDRGVQRVFRDSVSKLKVFNIREYFELYTTDPEHLSQV